MQIYQTKKFLKKVKVITNSIKSLIGILMQATKKSSGKMANLWLLISLFMPSARLKQFIFDGTLKILHSFISLRYNGYELRVHEIQ